MKNILLYTGIFCLFIAACSKADNTSVASNGSGKGGSLARFTIAMDHLFVVDNNQLYSYSLNNAGQPQFKSKTQIGTGIETIYAYDDKLFIGSQQAMYIYSISNPAQPEQMGTASHVRACDPVVANDNMAYVTVRSGGGCGGTQSALLTYNIQNVMSPRLLDTDELESPYGLGLNANRLYVCNGSHGLYVYDLTSPTNPRFIKKVTGKNYFDVIIYDNLLICMVQGGTMLYKMGANDDISELAQLAN